MSNLPKEELELRMNKRELAKIVAKESGLSVEDAKRVIDAVFKAIKDRMGEGESFSIRGFGSFSVRQREERRGRNPKTGETLLIPARKVPVFTPGKVLRGVAKKKASTKARKPPRPPKPKPVKPRPSKPKRKK